jgi:threonylcarbamoyladenosine tRNA methylthiotransferase MtaB
LQSGDDDILKRMNRPYTQREFHKLVLTINQQIPDAAIGVDTLIGFPGETDTAFNNTYQLIQDLPITYLHVFPFSARPGTPACTFAGQIEPQVIKDRCRRMRKLGHAKRKKFHRKFIDKKVQVLVESRRDRPTGRLKGISSNYLPVLVEGSDSRKNTFVDVTIEALNNNQLMGAIDR